MNWLLNLLAMSDEEFDDVVGRPIEPHAGDGDYYRRLADRCLTPSGRENFLRLAARCDRQGIEGRARRID